LGFFGVTAALQFGYQVCEQWISPAATIEMMAGMDKPFFSDLLMPSMKALALRARLQSCLRLGKIPARLRLIAAVPKANLHRLQRLVQNGYG
jgi:hypothetical protein